MKKYITKDKLTDFVAKMWEEGIKVETDPADNCVTLWVESRYLGRIEVYDKTTFDTMVADIVAKVKEEVA